MGTKRPSILTTVTAGLIGGFLFLSSAKADLKSDIRKHNWKAVAASFSYADEQELELLRSDLNAVWGTLNAIGSDKKTLKSFNRYVLGRVRGEDENPVMKALRLGSQMIDQGPRVAFLKAAEAELNKDDSKRFDAFIAKNELYKLPDGYKMVRPHLGTGKFGRVALVERISDGTLFAWKTPTVDDPELLKQFEKEVAYAKEWRKNGLTDMQVFLSPDGRSLFKTFISGPTLQRAMNEEDIFNHPESVKYKALVKFVRLAVRSKQYVAGVNAENLGFEKGRWQIIDGAHSEDLDTARETFQRVREAAERKWARDELVKFQPAIVKFFDQLNRHLPAAGKCSF